MNKGTKHLINVILAAIALAMGIAVIVLITIKADITTNEIIRMLAISSVSLGILALNTISKTKV